MKTPLIAIGDIHGCHLPLQLILKAIDLFEGPVIFLGDYVNRGPSSIDAVDLLIEAKQKHPDWIFLIGNHELFLIDHIKTGRPERIFPKLAFDEYEMNGGVPSEHHAFYDSLLTYWESESFIFVHGGIAFDVEKPIQEHDIRELTGTYEVSPWWRGKKLVRGHKIVSQPKEFTNHISLDTGCFKQTFLTAGIVDDSTGHLSGWIQAPYSGGEVSLHWCDEEL